jgi:hypothetical protein
MDEYVKDLARDLKRKYKLHGQRIVQIWHSLDQQKRIRVIKDGAYKGHVLRDPHDTRLGNVNMITPEWNLRDLTKTQPEVLLKMLEHRATSSLQSQYTIGMDGLNGDHAHIVDIMQNHNLRLRDAHQYENCYTLFYDEESYGRSIRIKRGNKREVLAGMEPAIRACLIVPQAVGDLILMRQQYLLQYLNMIIDDILDATRSHHDQSKRSEKPCCNVTKAMAKLSIHAPAETIDLPALLTTSLDNKSALEDYVDLMVTEPILLAHEVNSWFFSRPELVPDERGRTLPVHTDQYISAAVFDAVQNGMKAAALWTHMSNLLALLNASPEKHARSIILQEIANVCQLEFDRTQVAFKRAVSVSLGGGKWFKRLTTTRKDGLSRITVRDKPENLTRENPRIHYMLRLCQDGMAYTESAEWITKLDSLHQAHPLEREKTTEPQLDALGNLAVIVTFMQSLATLLRLPAATHKKEQLFCSRYTALEQELAQLRSGVDLGDFAIPIDNLLEPGMAAGALSRLDEISEDKAGTTIRLLYRDLVDDAADKIRQRLEGQDTEVVKLHAEYITPTAPEPQDTLVQRRREKEKTRPVQLPNEDDNPATPPQALPTRQVFRVKPSTSATFLTLLSRSSAARGSVSWDAFVAALTDLGFSTLPTLGSVYTFIPPESMTVQRKIALHRPHNSSIEGSRLLVFSRRLKRVYGWDGDTFYTT